MSRDHTRLRVFHDAHALTLAIYRHTKDFPKDEWFGMRVQMRRAAVSVSSNIVEGSARRSTREYCNFINIGLGSASELGYLIALANELGYLTGPSAKEMAMTCVGVTKQLQRLFDELNARVASEHGQ